MPGGEHTSGMSRKQRMKIRRRYEYEPLARLRPLPTYTELDERFRFSGANIGASQIDALDIHMLQLLDFEGDEYLVEGEPRPNDRTDDPDTRETVKIVRLFSSILDGSTDSELSPRQKEDLLSYFDRTHGCLPYNFGYTARFERLENAGLDPIKWKALKISRFGKGRKGNPNRERSAARVQFLKNPFEVPIRSPDSNFGEVLFFLSVENPMSLLRGLDESDYAELRKGPVQRRNLPAASARDERNPKELILAYVEIIEIEYTSDRVLLRTKYDEDTKKRKPRSFRFIDAKCIHSLIGLLTCEGRHYLTWEDNCWSTAGSSVAL
ncbi:hypothetical protein BJ508DRAFT_335416 [Ascobolus immersus RN42]|uniref:Uncharacterized protein n=1 Tax=Ascobolus immersus RN42 TaxID=1160509 RepID=A0A3N4HGX9_ASCIM|nr:hypothetical protein BJ508DRAFT_335416 [Ascobolus immersus RN42]